MKWDSKYLLPCHQNMQEATVTVGWSLRTWTGDRSMCITLLLLVRIWAPSLKMSGMSTCPCDRLWMRKGFQTWAHWKLMSGVRHPKRWEVTRCASTWAIPPPPILTFQKDSFPSPEPKAEPRRGGSHPARGSVWATRARPGLVSGPRGRERPRGAAQATRPQLPARTAPRERLHAGKGAGDCRYCHRPYLAAAARARPPLGRHGAGGAAPLPPPGPAQGAPRWRHGPSQLARCARGRGRARRSRNDRGGPARPEAAASGTRPQLSRPGDRASRSCPVGEGTARNKGRHARVTTTPDSGGHVLEKSRT